MSRVPRSPLLSARSNVPAARGARRGAALWPWLAAVLAACVTINVYFPEAEIRELSERIETEVRSEPAAENGNEADPDAPEEEPPVARRALLHFGSAEPSELRVAGFGGLGLLTGVAQAQVPEPAVMTPGIRKIIASRRARFPQLQPWVQQGVLGENNRALLEIRDLQRIGDLRQRAEVQRLVREENADREQLFREIAAAENVDLSQLPRIQQTYAETVRRVVARGTWIQQPDGRWEQKQ